MEEMFRHWELIVSIGMIFASHARLQANQKNSDRRVSKLEEKQDTTDEKLSDLKADLRELKGLTNAIYEHVKGK